MLLMRHPALQDLSRDHRLFLGEARNIRQYLEDHERARPLKEVIESLLTFWNNDGEFHLQEEEQIVYPVYLAVAPLKKREINALYTDHSWLREKMQELADLPRFENCSPLLRSLADYVVNHVRQEERVIYEAIQTTLSDEQLETVAEQSREFRRAHRQPEAIGEVEESIELIGLD